MSRSYKVTLLTIRADASLDRLLPFLATGEISAQDLMLGIKQDDWELALDKLQQAAKENVMPRLVAEVEDLRQKSELEREILAHDTVPELKAVQEVRQSRRSELTERSPNLAPIPRRIKLVSKSSAFGVH